jgi:ketosteroid isomerase-like protein
MAVDNEQVVRKAYQIAEDKDLEGWVAAFTADGTFTDESIGVTFRGPDGLPEQVENYARAFPGHAPRALSAVRQRQHRGGPAS